jgi:hypothetical protein
MMSRFACRILKFQPLLWNLCAAAAGCFAFMRGFRLVALGREDGLGPVSAVLDAFV